MWLPLTSALMSPLVESMFSVAPDLNETKNRLNGCQNFSIQSFSLTNGIQKYLIEKKSQEVVKHLVLMCVSDWRNLNFRKKFLQGTFSKYILWFHIFRTPGPAPHRPTPGAPGPVSRACVCRGMIMRPPGLRVEHENASPGLVWPGEIKCKYWNNYRSKKYAFSAENINR